MSFKVRGYMICDDDVCGTGGYSGPKPGDPDNNSVLSAVPAFGGIDVTWTYPSINPYAVAYVTLYRGITPDANGAIQIAQVAGTFYYDKQDNSNRYYYWIRITSVNGTIGALIGPASATANPTIEQVMRDLTGKIDSGVLAQSLKTEIDKITLNYKELTNEIAARIASNNALSAALASVQDGVDQSLAFVNKEIIERMKGQDALASQITTVAAVNKTNAAAITAETTARVSADTALSVRIDKVQVASDTASAAVKDITSSKIGYSADSQTNAPYDGDGVTIVYPSNIYPISLYPEYAVDRTRIIDSLGVVQWNAIKGSTKPLIWVKGMPVASTIKRVAVEDANGNQASLEQAFFAQKDVNDNLKAQYTAKVQITSDGVPIIGGFGIYGDQSGIEAGFDVDRFWIGRTDLKSKIKPFIVDQNTVYINDAAINKITFNKLRADDGSLIFEKGKLKANYIQVDKITNGAFTDYVWPAYGNGFYLGPGGLLIGNQPSGRYAQFTADGDVYLPGFTFVNGKLTISQQNVIGTLNIKDRAITVPKVLNNPSTIEASGSNIIAVFGTIELDQPAWVFAASTGVIGYGNGWRTANTALYINGQPVSYGGGNEAYNNAVHSGAAYCNAGTVWVQLNFNAQTGCRLINPSIFVQAVYK